MAPHHPPPAPTIAKPSRTAPELASSDINPNATEARDKALSKSPSYYESKSRKVHAAIKEVWSGASFTDVAKKYNQSPEALAVAFAVFGKEAFDIAEEKGVVSRFSPHHTPAYGTFTRGCIVLFRRIPPSLHACLCYC